MKRMNMEDLDQWFDKKKIETERNITRNRTSERQIRNREPDAEEQLILYKLCKKRWEKAEQEGKIKYLSKRKWIWFRLRKRKKNF